MLYLCLGGNQSNHLLLGYQAALRGLCCRLEAHHLIHGPDTRLGLDSSSTSVPEDAIWVAQPQVGQAPRAPQEEELHMPQGAQPAVLSQAPVP